MAVGVAIVVVIVFIYANQIVPARNYNHAMDMMESGDYMAAANAFLALGNFRDSVERAEIAASTAFAESSANLEPIRILHEPFMSFISVNRTHVVGLNANGRVSTLGFDTDRRLNVGEWRDIIAVSAGGSHTIGLRADGTVIAVGGTSNFRGIDTWQDIIAVAAGFSHTVGLRVDGTVVATGDGNRNGQLDVDNWRDIVAISAGFMYTVGLRADGTVMAVGSNRDGQLNVNGWRDIVAISTAENHTVGLRANGTVIVVGNNSSGQLDVSDWHNIVAVSAGMSHTVGLRVDGTVVAVGANSHGELDVDGWDNIVAISAGGNSTVGLRADGTLVGAGRNGHRQLDFSRWRLFDDWQLVDVPTVTIPSNSMDEKSSMDLHDDQNENENNTPDLATPNFTHTIQGLGFVAPDSNWAVEHREWGVSVIANNSRVAMNLLRPQHLPQNDHSLLELFFRVAIEADNASQILVQELVQGEIGHAIMRADYILTLDDTRLNAIGFMMFDGAQYAIAFGVLHNDTRSCRNNLYDFISSIRFIGNYDR